MQSNEIHLIQRPIGAPNSDNFAKVCVNVPPLKDGEIQVRNLYMAVDPAMRGRMNDAQSYVPPFELNAPMEGPAIGEVIDSKSPNFKAGDLVFSRLGWREIFNTNAEKLELRKSGHIPNSAHLTFAGTTGLTAYAGLLHIGGLKPNDVVFVSAASGGVGSLVCQIAKLKGHKVIAAAGGAQKTAYLKDVLGLDAVIDYKAEPNLTKALARAVKSIDEKGIDLYFDNVGGEHLHAAIALANNFARFTICGMISQYNLGGDAPMSPRNLMLMMGKRIRMQGYIATDHLDLWQHFEADMVAWHKAGLLNSTETIFEGIDNALNAFFSLFSGESMGRTLVKLA